MIIKAKKEVRVTLDLTEKEARKLMAVTQNIPECYRGFIEIEELFENLSKGIKEALE